MTDLKHKIESLQGPILVLGASGFIGANILRGVLKYRSDVVGSSSGLPRWRFNGIIDKNFVIGNLKYPQHLESFLSWSKPRTVLDLLAYGAYPFQKDEELMHWINVQIKSNLVNLLINEKDFKIYINAGTSSEYGAMSVAPKEHEQRFPDTPYAKSKSLWSSMILGLMFKDFPCANLRLYSVYGPYEDGSRLIPQVIQHGLRGEYPPFVRPDISRDFVYVDDVVEAFVDAALNLKPEDYGGSFNIGTGVKTTIREVALDSCIRFGINWPATFSMPSRDWDHTNDWYANPTKARERLGWQYKTSLTEGIAKTVEWYKNQGEEWEWPTIKPPTA